MGYLSIDREQLETGGSNEGPVGISHTRHGRRFQAQVELRRFVGPRQRLLHRNKYNRKTTDNMVVVRTNDKTFTTASTVVDGDDVAGLN